jgi:hypothetical protein
VASLIEVGGGQGLLRWDNKLNLLVVWDGYEEGNKEDGTKKKQNNSRKSAISPDINQNKRCSWSV